MKSLSIKQPWAELIMQGKKSIELRKWKTSFKGEFYVHASGNQDEEQMKRFNLKDLPRQAIIGKITLVEVKKYENEQEFLKDKNKHQAEKMEFGSYGFILENPVRLEKPIKQKGQLGFFEVDKN
ncbi:ASCH domain-containing protein [Candidatus Woesearchaeota archaeon]|nr:hypothetical protein [uncultured archaeon]AQS34782.1 hypothetical protein [uncultured archaeon]MBS3141287.1 ASCH domain-containing protein [Candidatus Woesearchaeota archaeon]